MLPANPYVLLVVIAALAGSHWYAYRTGAGHERNAAAAEALLIEKAGDRAAVAAAEAIARIEVKNVTIRQRVEREIHEKTIYRECRNTADGLRAINAALTGTDAVDRRELSGTRTDER